jgi:hypothetical protein
MWWSNFPRLLWEALLLLLPLLLGSLLTLLLGSPFAFASALLGSLLSLLLLRFWIETRRIADTLQRAQRECTRLTEKGAKAQQGADFVDSSVPVPHLRAAEVHLAAVERWLLGKHYAGADDREAHMKQLAEELGMAQGLAPKEEQEVFSAIFPPADGEAKDDEVLIAVLPCLVKANSFHYPGKLYLSSRRLCFYSTLMEKAIEAQLIVAWKGVGKMRVLAPTSKHRSESMCSIATRIRVALQDAMNFDGNEINDIDISMLDLESLGLLHRCATYFLGSGLFGRWQDPGDDLPQRILPTVAKTVCAMDSANQAVVWELERRTGVWSRHWRPPFLPHDGDKGVKWCALQDKYVPHPFLPEGTPNSIKACSSPPIGQIEVLGQRRQCSDWRTVVCAGTDDEGWQYGFDFYVNSSFWGPTCTSNSFVRRRQWRPRYTSLSSMSLVEEAVAKTTFMQEKNLNDAHPVFEADVGSIPLSLLAEEFECDDWLAPGRLMGKIYYEMFRAEDIDVSSWSTRMKDMKGKVRSVEVGRMPLPPAPMCPAETRMSQTYHAYHDESRVVIESVSTSLDVPYGNTFNVVVCDTFVSEGGCTRMIRTAGAEWLQSVWLQGAITKKVSSENRVLGEKVANLVREFAPKA